MRFSNRFGTAPVTMNSVMLGSHAVPFHGEPAVTIAAGASIMSDTFDFELAPLTNYTITINFGEMSNTVITGHPGSRSISYIEPGGASTAHWYIITGIDVMADANSAVVVVLGDSITDGRGSDTDKNNRWTDNLARSLAANPATKNIAVLNEGLGGNNV